MLKFTSRRRFNVALTTLLQDELFLQHKHSLFFFFKSLFYLKFMINFPKYNFKILRNLSCLFTQNELFTENAHALVIQIQYYKDFAIFIITGLDYIQLFQYTDSQGRVTFFLLIKYHKKYLMLILICCSDKSNLPENKNLFHKLKWQSLCIYL